MIDNLDAIPHHPAVEEIVEVICNKTQNTDKSFYRVATVFFLAKMASSQRAMVFTKDRGEVPINQYSLALGTSGFGKGFSVNILENEFLVGFRERFIKETMPGIIEEHLWKYANEKAAKSGTDPQDEYTKASSTLDRLGEYPFTFDSGTGPAVKQLRDRLMLTGIGSINLQIDEIGSNLEGNAEVLNVFLELYDQGLTKMKLTKNTAENKRIEELSGKTPTNMLMFGTDAKLLDGDKVEALFVSFLETGYARRCLFAFGQPDRKAFHELSAEEIYRRQIEPTNNVTISKWANHFSKLADAKMFGWKIVMEDEVAIKLLEYKIACEKAADKMKEHEQVPKAEMSHRYFKALKLAGTYAFIDQSVEVEMHHLMQAIKLVEESGKAFMAIMKREAPYMKLARYIADVETPLTHADLLEQLPFYKSGVGARNEMMSLAIAWGYPKHIIIKKNFVDGIEFFQGTKLKQTSLDKLEISLSDNFAYNYESSVLGFEDFEKLAVMTTPEGKPMHWCNHSFKEGYRSEESALPGFNTVVIDVDGGVNVEVVAEMLADYKFMLYTTKRHDPAGEHRFRLVFPIPYHLQLDTQEYKEFMNSFMAWLPFKTDEGANQRARKWETFAGAQCYTNTEGAFVDVLPFIPRTTRNDQYRKELQQVQSMDNLERWFAQRMAVGNRNENMIKFALALVDGGMTLQEVNDAVYSFNKKLSNSLPESEISQTIMKTVAKRFVK